MVSITTVDEGAVCTAMLDLYQNEGIIAEPAGALSVAALMEADIEPESTVVCLISGGNNDVSRYNEVLERSLVHLGLKHYFLVDFPQEPGALRRFLDTVLGPERRHHAVRVRQAQQPRDRRGAGRHRAGFGRRSRGSAGADEGIRHSRRDAGARLARLSLPALRTCDDRYAHARWRRSNIALSPLPSFPAPTCTSDSSLARKTGSIGTPNSVATL